MNWLTKRRPRCPFYREPTAAEAATLRIELQHLWRKDILYAGGAEHSPFTNVAYGTMGYVVIQMEREGLLVRHIEQGESPHMDRYIYTLTEAGRMARA